MPAPTLSVPTPCHESWQQMTLTAAGRHCAACQTVVVDFTEFTDAELLAYLGQRVGQPTCGRFRAGQLERPLRPLAVAAGVSRWRTWLAAAVAVWGLREAAAPAARAQAPTEQREPAIKSLPITVGLVAAPPVVVRGTVRGGEGPLQGVTILLAGTQVGVSSDASGQFELALPPAAVTMRQKLTVSSIGYETQQVELSAANQPLHVVLTPDSHMLGGMEMVGYSYYPWYTPRGLWQRVKRPFQWW